MRSPDSRYAAGAPPSRLAAISCALAIASEAAACAARVIAWVVWLPPETQVYCGHEYTESNARFALTIDPDNGALVDRAAEVKALRGDGKPTLPTTIGRERETNPFLRADDKAIRSRLGMAKASDAEVFAEIRRRKDRS